MSATTDPTAMELDLGVQVLDNGLFVEASAGTGKTYSIAALITRDLALRDDLRIGHIMVTTFTRNAAAELQDRVRRRLMKSVELLTTAADRTLQDVLAEHSHADAVDVLLLSGDPSDREQRAGRLRRALAEYDSATIGTIHSVCNKILLLAGESAGAEAEDERDLLINEVVNDVLLGRVAQDPPIDEGRLRTIVKQYLSEPLNRLWFDSDGRTGAEVALLEEVAALVETCAGLIEERSVGRASFADLIRRAREIALDPSRAALRQEFRRRFSLIIVDEAQDTDSQQWEVFRALFPEGGQGPAPGGDAALVAVGDPKQSIYKFRGADVDAYRIERDRGSTVTLTTNHRSDEPVLAGLNDLFAGATFGRGIDYREVHAFAGNKGQAVAGVAPVEVVRVPDVTNQNDFAPVVARKIASYLSGTVTLNGARVEPADIAVLVRSGGFGRMLQRRLRQIGVPAVCMGTDSVMSSESAEHWRVLLRALERYSDVGRVRHALSTPLFEVELTSSDVFDDGFIGDTQVVLAGWAATLRRAGVAGLAAEVLSTSDIVTSLGRGALGERRLTDFSHIADILHSNLGSGGCGPTEALEALAELANVDEKSELVSRRIESEEAAVKIMTVHAAKGLQFPVVVVADLWNPKTPQSNKSAPVFRAEEEHDLGVVGRVLDVGWVVGAPSERGKDVQAREEREEYARQLYVAVTRVKHHVCILHATSVKDSVLASVFDADALAGSTSTVSAIDIGSIKRLGAAKLASSSSVVVPGGLSVATLPASVEQTYRRTSFTAITDRHRERLERGGETDPVGGADEGERIVERRSGNASDAVPDGAHEMPLARFPGGLYVGKVLHDVYERVDPSHGDLESHVAQVVRRRVSARLRAGRESALVKGIVASLRTPLGGPLGQVTLCDIGTVDRRAEMNFEMSLPHLRAGLTVRDIGRVLVGMLADDDVLAPYARSLTDDSFAIPLAGLVNGSIDALLRVPVADGGIRLYVSDYKSNRLDRDGDDSLIGAYSSERMVEEMVHHHYPLQALLYGTAVYRFVRWRAPHLDADSTVGGFAYLFIRGMVGPDTPVDQHGRRVGVFTWEAPRGLWSRLSDLLAGDLP